MKKTITDIDLFVCIFLIRSESDDLSGKKLWVKMTHFMKGEKGFSTVMRFYSNGAR